MDSLEDGPFLPMIGDDDAMQLFEGYDLDESTDMLRQPSAFPFTFSSSLPKSSIFDEVNAPTEQKLSPESSLQETISNSSNERDQSDDADKSGLSKKTNGFGQKNWSNAQQNGHSMNFPDLEDSNQTMANHFDFESAASSPGMEIVDAGPVTRHVAISSNQSPMSFVSNSFMEDSTRGTSPMSTTVKSEISQSSFAKTSKQDRRANGAAVVKPAPQSLPFGYQIPQTIATPQARVVTHTQQPLVHGARPSLWVDSPKATSRVEIQIPIKLALHPFPTGIKKLHLQPYTISRPKFFTKPEHQPSRDTLELTASLFCASALSTQEKYQAAFEIAAEDRLSEKRSAARKLSGNKQAETTDAENPLNGAEVWVCDGCVNRERKRNDRKKAKKIEDEEHWKEYEYQRIIVFNTSELKDWEPYTTPQIPQDQRNYPLPEEPKDGAMQVDLPMRLVCYCRHQGEKEGFRVIFTIKTHLGEVIAQNITPPINITDDHKAAQKEALQAALWTNEAQAGLFHHNPPPPTGVPVRNAHSTTDLQGLEKAFSRPQVQGTSTPFANPQNFSQQPSASQTPRNMSRQASPGPVGPAAKKRKSSSNSGRLPESLKMTRLQDAGPIIIPSPRTSMDTGGSYPASPMNMVSPSQSLGRDQPFVTQTGPTSFASPDSNGFGYYRSSRSHSHENLNNMQAMYSAPASASASRAPSPGAVAPMLHEFMEQPLSMQPTLQMYDRMPTMHQSLHAPMPPSPPDANLIVHKVIPRTGPKAGGVEVTIIGAGFWNGLEIKFGDARATTTTWWSENTLVCLLPPARSAGKVPVTIHRRINGGSQLQYLPTQGKAQKFEYIDDDEAELMRRALMILGNKDNGRVEDATAIARRIVGQSGGSSSASGWHGNGPPGVYRQASASVETVNEVLDCEAAVLKCLDLIDLSDSLYRAQYELKGHNGQTILHLAASLGYQRLVAALLARGANPDARDNNGMSPMHMASLNDHNKIVRRLKLAGGDPTLRSLAGWTPMDMANSHATHFAFRTITPFDASSTGSRPSSAHSARSSIVFQPQHAYHRSLDVESDDSSEADSVDGEASSSVGDLNMKAPWIPSRRASTTDPLGPPPPSILDPTNHRYVQIAAAAAAWRDQAAAQWQQLQQTVHSLGLPPLQIPDYQNHTNQMMRRLGAFRGSRPTSSSDSKERLQADSQHWWEFLTGTSSPPAYEELYPASDTTARDVKTESAARAALETEADIKCRDLYDDTRGESSAASSTLSLAGMNDELLIRRRKPVKRLRSDRKLFLIWIPLLILLLAAMLKDRIPQAIQFTKRIAERFSEAKTKTSPDTVTASTESRVEIVA